MEETESIRPEDLVPENPHPRGRPVAPIADGLEVASRRSDAPRCAECPKHNGGTRWCPVGAAAKSGMEPACRYGRRLILSARTMRRKGESS